MLKVDCITNRVFNSRTYILSKEDFGYSWLVDCGDLDRVFEKIGDKVIAGVLLTHAHSDHIYGLEELIKIFPKVSIVTNAAGVEALHSPKMNLSHYHTDYHDIIIEAPNNLHIIKDGDELEVLGQIISVYETPGHCPSCLTYIMNNLAFTGDAYIPGVKVFTGFPQANSQQASASIDRILELTINCVIMPGHTFVKGEKKR